MPYYFRMKNMNNFETAKVQPHAWFLAKFSLALLIKLTMSDFRLTNLIQSHINKDHLTDTVHLANKFAERSEYRKFVFRDVSNV